MKYYFILIINIAVALFAILCSLYCLRGGKYLIGGLIKQEGKKWRTQIPILDEDQTNHLRKYSKEVASKICAMTKKDFRQLMDGINKKRRYCFL